MTDTNVTELRPSPARGRVLVSYAPGRSRTGRPPNASGVAAPASATTVTITVVTLSRCRRSRFPRWRP